MKILGWTIFACLTLVGAGGHAIIEKEKYPDLGGIVDFSYPSKVTDRVFILTNPKSGSHLLIYSIMKVTQRPMRGRLHMHHFLENPDCFPPENIMEYPVDFTKPTTYWGHEYRILRTLNHGRNKLIFLLRDYKETLISEILLRRDLLPPGEHLEEIGDAILEEVVGRGPLFSDMMSRLMTFDQWDPRYRYLVRFTDIVRDANFLPPILAFMGDDSPYEDFVENYKEFKIDLLQKYRKKNNATHSGEKLRFFRQYVSPKLLKSIDTYVEQAYPDLWRKYLKEYQEM